MNEERRPDEVETANTRTTNPAPNLNRPQSSAARSGNRSVAIVTSAFARTWQVLAACRRDLELIEQHRAQRGVR